MVLVSVTPAYAVKDQKSSIEKVVYDFEKIPKKVFIPQPLKNDVNMATNITWTARTNLFEYMFFSDHSSDSKLQETGASYPIDLIYVKGRLYVDGNLRDSEVDEATNASYAGVRCDTGIPVGDASAYGNHKFEEAGYQSWYPETYDT